MSRAFGWNREARPLSFPQREPGQPKAMHPLPDNVTRGVSLRAGRSNVRYQVSDLRLQELRRRFVESPSVQAEADYLVECLRLGTVDRQSVELAARLGHSSSILIT